MTSCSRQSRAIVSSSARVKTRPVGLFGVLTMIAFVRGVNAFASSSASNSNDGGRSGKIREPLSEVDAAVYRTEPRHLADDRLGESDGPPGNALSRGSH